MARKKIYYQTNTTNDSFLKMYRVLQSMGIKRNKFHLKLYDKRLALIDPHDPNLTVEEQAMVLAEVKQNFFYFAREVVRISVAGGKKPYGLHRGNLALSWCLINNFNTIQILPRQNGKTIGAAVFYLWLYNFATVNSEMMLLNKKYDDSKLNLQRIKEMRELLPQYLQLIDDKKDQNNITILKSGTNKNTLVAKPTAKIIGIYSSNTISKIY